MKKAKIMLSAIAAIAITSGILAFKAHYRCSPRIYYFCSTTGAATTGTCTTALANVISLTTIQLQGFIQFTTYATLATITTACTLTTIPQQGGCNVPLYAFGPCL